MAIPPKNELHEKHLRRAGITAALQIPTTTQKRDKLLSLWGGRIDFSGVVIHYVANKLNREAVPTLLSDAQIQQACNDYAARLKNLSIDQLCDDWEIITGIINLGLHKPTFQQSLTLLFLSEELIERSMRPPFTPHKFKRENAEFHHTKAKASLMFQGLFNGAGCPYDLGLLESLAKECLHLSAAEILTKLLALRQQLWQMTPGEYIARTKAANQRLEKEAGRLTITFATPPIVHDYAVVDANFIRPSSLDKVRKFLGDPYTELNTAAEDLFFNSDWLKNFADNPQQRQQLIEIANQKIAAMGYNEIRGWLTIADQLLEEKPDPVAAFNLLVFTSVLIDRLNKNPGIVQTTPNSFINDNRKTLITAGAVFAENEWVKGQMPAKAPWLLWPNLQATYKIQAGTQNMWLNRPSIWLNFSGFLLAPLGIVMAQEYCWGPNPADKKLPPSIALRALNMPLSLEFDNAEYRVAPDAMINTTLQANFLQSLQAGKPPEFLFTDQITSFNAAVSEFRQTEKWQNLQQQLPGRLIIGAALAALGTAAIRRMAWRRDRYAR